MSWVSSWRIIRNQEKADFSGRNERTIQIRQAMSPPAPTHLASQAFCALYQYLTQPFIQKCNEIQKKSNNINKKLCLSRVHEIIGRLLLVIDAVFSLCMGSGVIVGSCSPLVCWATCPPWTGRSGRDQQLSTEQLWQLTNQWYFMIVAAILDILFFQKDP